MPAETLRAMVDAWRDAVSRGTASRLHGDEAAARASLARADELQRSIDAQLRGLDSLVPLLARVRARIEETETARAETAAGLPGEDPKILSAEVDLAIEDLLRGVAPQRTLLVALDETRARLRVHAEGPFLNSRSDIDKLADVEGGRLIDQVGGRIGAADARQVLRGELYALLLASPRWRWLAGDSANRAMRLGQEALARALQRAGEPWPTYVRLPGRPLPGVGVGPPRDLPVKQLVVESRPKRAQLEALLIQMVRQIQEEIPRGEGTDADVQRITDLWKWALSPFLRPFYLREHPAASVDELRGPFDSLIHDLVELAFRELGHARITAPPFGGRPLAAWVVELRRRRERALGSIA